jgi:integrase
MARHRENLLRIIPLAGGSWLLDGFHLGKRIRKQGRDVNALRVKMQEMQAVLTQASENIIAPRMTRLTEAQLRDAEAAVERAGGRSLLACVITSERVMVTGEKVALVDALSAWVAHQEKRGRHERTIEGNISRARAFIAEMARIGVNSVDEVRPEHFEAWVYRGERADFTRKGDASVLQAWANFWLKPKRWVKESPFEVDMRDLKSRARAIELPRILTPAQAHGLLAAAKRVKSQGMAAYVALACWCFMRHAEALRVTPADMKLERKAPVVEVRPRKRGTVSYRPVTVPACVLPILVAAKARALATGEPVATCKRVSWDGVREAAGLAKRGPVKNKKRAIESEIWQENILRHTGLSYHFQRGQDIADTTRQAGNSSATAFAHYLVLPEEGAADEFFEVMPPNLI